MPLFDYTARSDTGKAVHGAIEAPNSGAAALRLESSGLLPIEIALRQAQVLSWQRSLQQLGLGAPSTTDLVLLTRQMYTIAKAGLPWLRGLRGLAATTQQPVLRAALENAAVSLEAGRDLSQALDDSGGHFPQLYIAMVRVGEQTGTLDTVLLRLAEHLQNQQDLRDRVKGAMRYPIIVIGAIVVSMAVLSVMVIPKFAPMFRQLGDALPLPTQILLVSSSFVKEHWLMVAIGAGVLALAFVGYVRTATGRYVWHSWRLQWPIFGKLAREAILARIVRTLSLTLAAGLPMIQALKLIGRAADNDFIGARINQLREKVETGESLSAAAAGVQIFPPLLLQMMEVGEETGELTRLLDEVADYYQREVDYTLKNLSALIEPILMVVVGAMVLILALGIFLPLWEMIGKVSAGG